MGHQTLRSYESQLRLQQNNNNNNSFNIYLGKSGFLYSNSIYLDEEKFADGDGENFHIYERGKIPELLSARFGARWRRGETTLAHIAHD